MEKINLIKPEKINLKDHPILNEHWLQDTMAKDPEILGLGDLILKDKERKQGIGQKLIKFGINYLKKNNVKLLFTYGDPNYYSKIGFKYISESIAKAPLKLTYPEGWLAQSLVSKNIEPISGNSTCVRALNSQQYW